VQRRGKNFGEGRAADTALSVFPIPKRKRFKPSKERGSEMKDYQDACCTKKNKRGVMKFLSVSAIALLFLGGYFVFSALDSKAPAAVAAKKTYRGTVYVAGMGGHFAKADLTIDPNNTEQPITVNNLNMISIGTKLTHPTHDPRIDYANRDILYWSTYKLDPEGNLHVGKTELKTGMVIKDVAMPKPDRAVWTGANYCASGQSKTSFIPISMANEGYVDIIDKKTLKLEHRIFMSDLGYKPGTYTFAHGTNTPDMKRFLLTLNLSPEGHQKWTGNTELIMLDMAAIEKGKIKILARNTITGTAGKTITFRQNFSPDGRYIFQSGADRGYLIDGKTLTVLDRITEIPGENHDIIGTPDAKYAVMTLRENIKDKDGKEIVDGRLLLYDVNARKVVGKSVSVCYACHQNMGQGSAVLCGIDANWRK
jgi:hypothetical protein